MTKKLLNIKTGEMKTAKALQLVQVKMPKKTRTLLPIDF